MMATTSKWSLKRLKDITSKIGSGATPLGGKNDYKAEGISLIRSQNIYDLKVMLEQQCPMVFLYRCPRVCHRSADY